MNKTVTQWTLMGVIALVIVLMLALLRGCRGGVTPGSDEIRPEVTIAINVTCEGVEEPPIIVPGE